MMEQVRKLLIPFVFALTRQRSYDPSIRVAARHSSYLRRARDDQSASLFTPGALVSPDPHVPQRVARRTQPIGQGQYRRYREAWMRTVAGFQPIVGNPRRNMVDVVETDTFLSPIATGVAAGETSCHAALRHPCPTARVAPSASHRIGAAVKIARHRQCSPAL